MPSLLMASSELANRPATLDLRRQLTTSFDMLFDEFELDAVEPGATVLLVAGRTEIDEAAAKLLAVQLANKSVPTRVLPAFAINPEAIERLEVNDVSLMAMVFLGPDIRSQARYVSRRLRRRRPDLPLVACAFGMPDEGETTERLHLDAIYRDHKTAARELEDAWRKQVGQAKAPNLPRLVLDAGNSKIQAVLQKIITEFEVPVARIDLLEDRLSAADPSLTDLTAIVSTHERPYVISAKENAEIFASNEFLQANGVHLYLGAPLSLPDGSVLGALILLDYKDRDFSAADLAKIEQLAAEISSLAASGVNALRATPASTGQPR
jgi:hypothetical protein